MWRARHTPYHVHMDHQRVFVKVVGFTDVERHALNTVFRLSEHRDPAYAPWIEGVQGMPAAPEVLLVDGESAEAVLTHVRELPAGQRLIWVGPGAPAHAWRVLSRPIQWAILLTDLDAMFAARLADSGYVDLDISTPVPLDATAGALQMERGLLVGPDGPDRQRLTDWLGTAGFESVDTAPGTDEAVALIGRQTYAMVILDIDAPLVDAWSLAALLARTAPDALVLGLSEHAGPLTAWWRRRRLIRHVDNSPMHGLLARPVDQMQLREAISRWRRPG